MESGTKPTRYYLCSDTDTGILSAIYDAGLSCYGHRFIRILPLAPQACYEQTLFSEYVTVVETPDKADSVLRSIREQLSPQIYQYVMCTLASTFPDRGDVLYQFITYAFHMGDRICHALQVPFVKRIFEIQRRVQNEAHYLREFIRFRQIRQEPPVLAANIEPDHHILPMITEHFADRYHMEWFVILDITHQEAAFHAPDKDWYLQQLSPEDTEKLARMEENGSDYADLWKTFFEHIGIKERKNPALQRSLLPLHYRKHLTEFQD